MKSIVCLLLFTLSLNAATVYWSPVDGATNYHLYFGTNQAAAMPWSLAASTSTTNTIVPEIPGATNYFYATGFTADGETLPSDIAFHPRVPVARLSSGLSSDTITVTANPLSDKVTLYCVYWSLDKNAPLPWALLSSNVNTVITVTGNYGNGLKNCYYATARSLSGESGPSSFMIRNPGPAKLTVNQ